MTPASNIIGILLAAGFSRRFGSENKLKHLLSTGEPIGLAAAKHLVLAIPFSIAVIRKDDLVLAKLLGRAGINLIACPTHKEKMADSLASAVEYAAEHRPAGYVIALADMPFIRSETIALVAEQIQNGASIVIPTYLGQRGHPVGFSAVYTEELKALSGDEGARSIIKRHAEKVVTLACDDPGILKDIDTLEDLS